MIDPKVAEQNNKFLWDRFIKLGDMMGDGLHHESDGKWIVRDYNRLAKILIPEIKERNQRLRKLKAIETNKKIDNLIASKSCKCGGRLIQKRSGTTIIYCMNCNTRYRAVYKKQ